MWANISAAEGRNSRNEVLKPPSRGQVRTPKMSSLLDRPRSHRNTKCKDFT